VNPVVAALLFHAPGLRLFAKRRLTPLALKLNLVAGGATLLAMAIGFFERGALGAVVAWAVGHTLWSITLATLVHRGIGARHDAP
jgi:hypothetical protein